MSTLDALWAQPATQALAVALAQFLWQGTAIALAVAALMSCMGRRPARERYALACLGLLAMVVLPVATFRSELAGGASGGSAVSTAMGDGAFTGAPEATLSAWLKAWLGTLSPWLMSAWLCGVLLLSLRTVWAWRQAIALGREGTLEPGGVAMMALVRMMERTGVGRPVRLLKSVAIEVPMVVGLWRPLILVPASTLSGLSVSQLEAILAHELAHIRRHDYLVNLLQALAETALFYHPAVWWLSARIREEREHCADDVAVESCGDALLYSRALATLEQLRASTPAPAVAANGGSLLLRIQRLLAGHPSGAPLHPWRLAGSLAAALLVVVLGASQQAQATGTPSEPPAPQASAPPTAEQSREEVGDFSIDTLPFSPEMTRPQRLSGPIPQYTKEALENRSEGLMIVRCIITVEGEVNKCRVLQPLPFMEEAVLDALYQSRYKPVTLDGKPVQVDYTFNIRLSLPVPDKKG
jgi:TonB family protein